MSEAAAFLLADGDGQVPPPKVSIVIPVYNGANYLGCAVDSALGQSYTNIEVIVVNDGSTDGGATESIALSYDDRIRYFHKPNGHVASALNFGIRRMAGDYFSWLSHDDIYKPDKIALQMDTLSRLPAGTLAYSDYEILDVATQAIAPFRMRPVPPEHFRYHLTLDNSMHGCTLLIPKGCLDAAGPFNERLRTTQDYDMWFRLSRCCRFAYVPGIVVTSRSHPEQGSLALRDLAQPESDRLVSEFVRDLTPQEIEAASRKAAARAYVAMAGNLERRGFALAAETALSLARSHAGGGLLARARFLADWLLLFWLPLKVSWLRRKLRGAARRLSKMLPNTGAPIRR